MKNAQMNIFDLQTFVLFFVSEIIDDLAHLVDKTDSRIHNETRRVKLVETKSASCGEPSSDFCPNCSKPDINWMSFKTNQLTSITNDQGMGLMNSDWPRVYHKQVLLWIKSIVS